MANTLATTRAYHVIRGELFRRAYRATEKAEQIIICCPFHDERTPSCGVNISAPKIPVGYFHCFGCGAKGPWNVLAEKMGMQKLTNFDLKSIEEVAPNMGSKFAQIKDDLLEDYTDGDWKKIEPVLARTMILDVDQDYQPKKNEPTIRKELLQKMGVKRMIDPKTYNTFLILPVMVNEQTVGIVRARVKKKKGSLSYITSPGGWVKRSGLFGYDYAKTLPAWKKFKILFIVEGPRDALRLLQMGIPAVAILGAKNWSKNKVNLVLDLNPKRVCILFDNDTPGRRASRKIYGTLKRVVPTRRIKLPHKDKIGKELDPANLPSRSIKRIWIKLRKEKLNVHS